MYIDTYKYICVLFNDRNIWIIIEYAWYVAELMTDQIGTKSA